MPLALAGLYLNVSIYTETVFYRRLAREKGARRVKAPTARLAPDFLTQVPAQEPGQAEP